MTGRHWNPVAAPLVAVRQLALGLTGLAAQAAGAARRQQRLVGRQDRLVASAAQQLLSVRQFRELYRTTTRAALELVAECDSTRVAVVRVESGSFASDPGIAARAADPRALPVVEGRVPPSLLIDLARGDARVLTADERARVAGDSGAVFAAPIRGRDAVHAAVLAAGPRALPDVVQESLRALGWQASFALDNLLLTEELRQSESRFRSLVESSSDVIGVVAPTGALSFLSESSERVFGVRPETLAGRRLVELVHPEDAPRALAALSDVMLQPAAEAVAECRVRHADGSWRVAEWTFKNLVTDPSVAGIVVNARDLSAHRQAEQARRDSDERFQRLAENLPDILFRYDVWPRRGFSYVSPAITSILGYPPEICYAEPELALLPLPGDLEQTDRRPTIAPVRHRDGHIVWIEQRLLPLRDESGRLRAIEGIARDVSRRRRLEEQLLRSQRLEAAGRVSAQVAHDFNNLLGPLVAYPELIKRRLPAGHPAGELCEAMLVAARRMTDINDDLLTLGRRGLVPFEPLDLNEVVRDAVGQPDDESDPVEIDLRLGPDVLPIKGAAKQILRAICNLVGNARDAMPDGGRLTIRTENVYLDEPLDGYSRVEIGEYVHLQIRDTGTGIPEAIRDRVFEPFFTTKRTGGRLGSGLGLSVVQAIVEDHHGRLDVDSAEGEGTTFDVYLPVCREAVEQRPARRLEGGGERLLVVDDDHIQREVARQLLEGLGYEVVVVRCGEEAIAYLGEQPVDLLVLDMIMPPGIDGAETFRRAALVRPGQRAVILSGYADSDRVQKALALGVHGFVRKPVTTETIGQAVRDALDRPADDRPSQRVA